MTFLFFCLGMLAGIIIVLVYAAALNWRDARRDRERIEQADTFAKEQSRKLPDISGHNLEMDCNRIYYSDFDADVREAVVAADREEAKGSLQSIGQRKGLRT